MRLRALLAVAAGARAFLLPPCAHRKLGRTRVGASEDDDEFTRVVEFNSGLWRGTVRSTLIDPASRTSKTDVVLDGREYTSCFKASRAAGVDEALAWTDADLGDREVTTQSMPAALSADYDGSFSVEYEAHGLGGSPTYEAAVAVGDDARVRVLAAYDGAGNLRRVACLDETRVVDGAAAAPAAAAARAADVRDVFGLAGEWRGDATVRKRGRASNVIKQDVRLETDGDRLFRAWTGVKWSRETAESDANGYRSRAIFDAESRTDRASFEGARADPNPTQALTVYDAAGVARETLESFGTVAASRDATCGAEVVVFDGATALVLRAGTRVRRSYSEGTLPRNRSPSGSS